MVAQAIRERVYSAEEYLEMEERAVNKHEFLNGKIIEMAGAGHRHNQIAANITAALIIALEEKTSRYIVYNSDMKIQIPHYNHFVYPDTVVICEKPELYKGRTDTILNPLLVVEVLSSSTADYDRGTKFTKYKTIPSFKEYVLVEQDMIEVTSSFRVGDRLWEDSSADNLESSLYLASLDIHLPLKRVYKNVDF